MRFGIEVASVNYRVGTVFGDEEARASDVGGKFAVEGLFEFGAIGVEGEAERAAEDDAVGFDGGD